MSIPPVILRRCRRCSKWRHPEEFVAGPIIGYCFHCYEGHQRALELLAGTALPGCQECLVTFEQLRERAGNADVRMYLHLKDGIYQVLCAKCSEEYERKRLDLYGDTPYGLMKKLKG